MISLSDRDFPLFFPVILADIGGTNTRFSILRDRHSELYFFPTVNKVSFDSLEQALQETVLDKISFQPRSAILAVAGPVDNQDIKLTNYKWLIQPDVLFSKTELRDILVINDFEAQALAIAALSEKDYEYIGGNANNAHSASASRVVIGPGTGLGISALIRVKNAWSPVSSEGGHIDIGPRSERDFEIFPYLQRMSGRVSAEQLLSGRGLVNIYKAICAADGIQDLKIFQPEDIISSISQLGDRVSYETVKLFCQYLGRVAGDIALVFMARDGVYLSGGIPHNIIQALCEGGFRSAFEDKEPHRDLMRTIPTYIIVHPCIAIVGMSSYLREPDNFCLKIEGAGRRWIR